MGENSGQKRIVQLLVGIRHADGEALEPDIGMMPDDRILASIRPASDPRSSGIAAQGGALQPDEGQPDEEHLHVSDPTP